MHHPDPPQPDQPAAHEELADAVGRTWVAMRDLAACTPDPDTFQAVLYTLACWSQYVEPPQPLAEGCGPRHSAARGLMGRLHDVLRLSNLDSFCDWWGRVCEVAPHLWASAQPVTHGDETLAY